MSAKPGPSLVRSRRNTVWLVVAAATVSMPALAHHSANMFDLGNTIEVKGTVKEFHWTNPHSWVIVESQDAAGKVSDWSFEANGPGYLVRNGWKRESLKPGDKVTITANPMRDGSAGGNLVRVAMPDGHELSARVGGPPPGAGGAPGAGGGAPGAGGAAPAPGATDGTPKAPGARP